MYFRLEEFLDSTIDDINARLNSNFPAFSELYDEENPLDNFNYNYFPDKYIREVVCKGAAYKVYIMDEEGIVNAEQYRYDYETALFLMQRDYIEQVPDEYRCESKGSVLINESDTAFPTPFNFKVW